MFFQFITIKSVPSLFIKSEMFILFSLIHDYLSFLIRRSKFLVEILMESFDTGFFVLLEFRLRNDKLLLCCRINEINLTILIGSFVIILF